MVAKMKVPERPHLPFPAKAGLTEHVALQLLVPDRALDAVVPLLVEQVVVGEGGVCHWRVARVALVGKIWTGFVWFSFHCFSCIGYHIVLGCFEEIVRPNIFATVCLTFFLQVVSDCNEACRQEDDSNHSHDDAFSNDDDTCLHPVHFSTGPFDKGEVELICLVSLHTKKPRRIYVCTSLLSPMFHSQKCP